MTSTSSSLAQQRATICFLTANIHLGSGRALWPGVAEVEQLMAGDMSGRVARQIVKDAG